MSAIYDTVFNKLFVFQKNKDLVFCPFAVELESNSSKHGKSLKASKEDEWKGKYKCLCWDSNF